jgi:hypothetical protein
VNFRFFVLGTAPSGFTPITIVTNPVPAGQTPFSVSDQAVNVTSQVVIENGGITIVPATAAGVTVGGRVTLATGAALRNATVIITDATGSRRTVLTNSFGYYSFDEVEAGGSYVLTVSSRRYRFASRVVNVDDNVSDADFVAAE